MFFIFNKIEIMARQEILDQYGLNFVTITVVDWVDVFIRKEYKELIIESLHFCQKDKGLLVFCYVIMSNHLHLMVQAGGTIPLTDILRDFKKFTAWSILKDLESNKQESRRAWMLKLFREHGHRNSHNQKYQFWQRGSYPILLFSPKIIRQKMGYIHANPVVQGWVEQAEDYWFSSALYYKEKRGPLKVDIMDLGVTEGYILPDFK
jgi:putative transposase